MERSPSFFFPPSRRVAPLIDFVFVFAKTFRCPAREQHLNGVYARPLFTSEHPPTFLCMPSSSDSGGLAAALEAELGGGSDDDAVVQAGGDDDSG